MFSVDARLAGKRGPDVPGTYRRLLDELRAVPGARSVSLSSVRPVSDGYYFVSVVSKFGDKALPNDQGVRVAYNNLAPGYFATLGIPLVAGRDVRCARFGKCPEGHDHQRADGAPFHGQPGRPANRD